MEPHPKRISMSNKITRNFKIGTLHRIAIYLLASQKNELVEYGTTYNRRAQKRPEQSDTLLGGNDLQQKGQSSEEDLLYYGSDTNTY